METNLWTKAQTQATTMTTAIRYGKSSPSNTALANRYPRSSSSSSTSQRPHPKQQRRYALFLASSSRLTPLQRITVPRVQSHKNRSTTTVNIHPATALTTSPSNSRHRAASRPIIRPSLPSPAHLQRRRKCNAHLPAPEQTAATRRPGRRSGRGAQTLAAPGRGLLGLLQLRLRRVHVGDVPPEAAGNEPDDSAAEG